MTAMPELSAEYAFRLIEEQEVQGLRASESHVELSAGRVLFAVDQVGRHLLVPVRSVEDIAEDLHGRAIQIRRRLIGSTESDAIPYLDLICSQRVLAPKFATFIDDLLGQLEGHPTRPHDVVTAVLGRWRDLMHRGSNTGMSEDRLVGLFGELHVLAKMAEADPHAALECWTGWAGDRWDFRSSTMAAEVKATSRHEDRGFWVHGAEQLDTREGVELVVHLRRYRRDEEGSSITDVLAELASRGVDHTTVRTRLAQVGWQPSDPTIASRYSVAEQWTWRVDDSFPSVVADSFVGGAVPERVSSIRYWVDLRQPPPAPMQESEFDTHLSRMVAECR